MIVQGVTAGNIAGFGSFFEDKALLRIDKNDIYSRAVVQFLAAQLAQTDDAEIAAYPVAVAVFAVGNADLLCQLQPAEAEHRLQAQIRQIGEFQDDLFGGTQFIEIAHRDAEDVLQLEFSQQPAGRLEVPVGDLFHHQFRQLVAQSADCHGRKQILFVENIFLEPFRVLGQFFKEEMRAGNDLVKVACLCLGQFVQDPRNGRVGFFQPLVEQFYFLRLILGEKQFFKEWIHSGL